MLRTIFCGLGALGSHAVTSSRGLELDRVLIDGDRVENRNLDNQAYVRSTIGKNKAEALALQLRNFWRLPAAFHGQFLREHNVATLLEGSELIVDCLDNHEGRQLLIDYARERRVPIVHAGVAGDASCGLVRWGAAFTGETEQGESADACRSGRYLPLLGQIGCAVAQAIAAYLEAGQRPSAWISSEGVEWTGPNGP